jgi:hypothetical protein
VGWVKTPGGAAKSALLGTWQGASLRRKVTDTAFKINVMKNEEVIRSAQS